MARRGSSLFTIYHVMDKKGAFDSNPANAQAINEDGLSIYKGPVPFPKMLYHPKGERELVSVGTIITDRTGEIVRDKDGEPKFTGRIWGTKNRIVNDQDEYLAAKAEGWLDTEAEALRNNVQTAAIAPPKTLLEQQAEELAALRAKIAEMELRNNLPVETAYDEKGKPQLPVQHRKSA